MPNDINVNVENAPAPAAVPVKTVKTVTTKPSRTPWQRLALSLVAIAIIYFGWERATNHLYALPQQSISAFNSITNNAFYVIGALCIFFVSGKLIYDWKNTTASSVVEETHHLFEDKKAEIDQKIDQTYTAINLTGSLVHEGDKDAPDAKPFGQHATKA